MSPTQFIRTWFVRQPQPRVAAHCDGALHLGPSRADETPARARTSFDKTTAEEVSPKSNERETSIPPILTWTTGRLSTTVNGTVTVLFARALAAYIPMQARLTAQSATNRCSTCDRMVRTSSASPEISRCEELGLCQFNSSAQVLVERVRPK